MSSQKEAEPLLSIGAVSRKTGVSVDTIRYYERIGLLSPYSRSRGRHRLYTTEELRILSFVRRGRELGYPLDDIRALLELANSGSACGRAKQITERHLASIRERVAKLRKLERALGTMTDQCHPNANSGCPIIDALSGDRSD
jgi:MerR family transcriptional regulator, mercuric resistance operon regulatory protein